MFYALTDRAVSFLPAPSEDFEWGVRIGDVGRGAV